MLLVIRVRGTRIAINRPYKLLVILVLFFLVIFGNLILKKIEDIERISAQVAADSYQPANDWQKVNGSKTLLYVYSAYYLKNPA